MDEKSVWRFFLEFYVRLCFNEYIYEGDNIEL
jgi:hypothetical protein